MDKMDPAKLRLLGEPSTEKANVTPIAEIRLGNLHGEHSNHYDPEKAEKGVPLLMKWSPNSLGAQETSASPSRSQSPVTPTIIGPDGDVKKPTFQNVRNCFLSDGKRIIDYVLAYDDEMTPEQLEEQKKKRAESSGEYEEVLTDHEKHMEKRKVYEKNLQKLGLKLERVDARFSKAKYVLIHAPYEVLAKQAEFMRIKLPVRRSDMNDKTFISGFTDKFLQRFRFLDFDPKLKEKFKEPEYFTAPFVRAHAHLFLNSEDSDHFFPQSERSRMVYELLLRTRYDSMHNDKCRIGIERLLANETYTAAFPVHEELVRGKAGAEMKPEEMSDRQMLYNIWARWNNFYKYQPLSLIKRYFGSKIGLYYAWLGYYTKALFPASLIGLICVFYGVTNMSQNIPSNDICARDGVGKDVIMCPTCDRLCDFWYLNTSCTYAKITYVVDNGATVFFAAIMSIWATLFIEGWKRYHAEVAWKWDLLDFEVEEETIRPEFQFSVTTKRENPVTKQLEPYLPLSKRIFRMFGSCITVLFALLLVLGFTFGIIMYRIILVSVLHTKGYFFKANAVLVTTVTAACINLVFIIIMGYVYYYIALKLTEWECPRTQTDFESSYTFKVFLFNFVNYYSSLFYIAFVKGKISGVPGADATTDREHGRFRVGGYRMEDCDPSGCMLELVIQLAIIMCGRQFFNSLIEICWPLACLRIRRWKGNMQLPTKQFRQREAKRLEMESHGGVVPRWEHDNSLYPVYDLFLFDEYLEMVIQFGFVTLFVSAFPLAPVFALLNNIMEIRLDAWKFLVVTQRPLPARARDIGIWLPILDGVSKIAVLINACIIAFTSDFVPKMLYVMTHDSGNLNGYVNYSLSYANSTMMRPENQYPNSPFANVTVPVCRFRDYRKPPCGLFFDWDCDDEYGFSFKFWHIFAARLAFVLIFEHVVYVIKGFFAYMIPDMPTTIFIRLQRERYLARQAQLQQSATEVNSSQEADSPEFDDMRCASRDVKKRFAGKVAAGDHNEVAFQPGSFEDCADLSNVKMREHEKDHPPPKPAEQGPSVTMTSSPGRESYHSAKSRYENDGESSRKRSN